MHLFLFSVHMRKLLNDINKIESFEIIYFRSYRLAWNFMIKFEFQNLTMLALFFFFFFLYLSLIQLYADVFKWKML